MPICICGKTIDEGELWCSPRCEYVTKHINALLDRQAAELVQAKQYFGEEWDEVHPNE